MLNIQPILIGKLIRLRPITQVDYEPLYKVCSDPYLWYQHPYPLRYQRPVYDKFFQKALACRGGLIIEDTQSTYIIGSSRYYHYRPEKRDIFMGFTFLAKKYFGGNYNQELKFLMMNHIFQGVDRIFFSVGSNNHRSRKAMVKIGGQLLTTEYISDFDIDIRADSVGYMITKQQFLYNWKDGSLIVRTVK